jgi:LEA14-like dessication related protein
LFVGGFFITLNYYKLKKILAQLFLLNILVFSSCSKFQEITFSGVEDVKVLGVSQKGAELEIRATINNPNKRAFNIYPSVFDATVNGISLGKARLDKRVRIKAKSQELYTFHIVSDFSTIGVTDLPKIMSLALSRNAKVNLKGNIKAGKLFVKKSMPIDVTKDVPLHIQK